MRRTRFRSGALLQRVARHQTLNYLLTNHIPRRFATTLAGRIARIENRWLTKAGIVVWQAFGGSLALHEADTSDFVSLEQVFTRRLKDGARHVDSTPDLLTSPCDAVVGACGFIEDGMAIQAKGSPYPINDLLLDNRLVARHRGGRFITLRLRSTMYHRFHAPCDGRVRSALWIAGDTWNVNPAALKRIDQLYCKNERVVVDLEPTQSDCTVTLVAVAAILVASVHLNCLDVPPRLQRGRLARFRCGAFVRKGDELGHFRNGSTIILFASHGFAPCDALVEGATVRVGEPLLRRPHASFSGPTHDLIPSLNAAIP
ncbi:MAG TPA: archaetidylserine decarboxylase [Gemmatimonadaceae bacterium]